jgi:hypothetical protein
LAENVMRALMERLEVRIPSPMIRQLRQEANRRGEPVAELVREAIAEMLDRERHERERAAEALFGINAPVSDWEQMKREISAAYSNPPADE